MERTGFENLRVYQLSEEVSDLGGGPKKLDNVLSSESIRK
jgi:hypothetical protein